MAQNGLRSRRKKREVADFLLANIDSDAFRDRMSGFVDLEPNSIRLETFKKEFPNTYQQYNSALQLLVFNKHLTLWWPDDCDPEFSDPYLSTTREGMEAHYEGHYQKEN
jgi:hypothetical protein